MMLVTRACSPPTWAATLPQKFSAATTCTLPESTGVGAELSPHPVRANAAGRSTGMRRQNRETR